MEYSLRFTSFNKLPNQIYKIQGLTSTTAESVHNVSRDKLESAKESCKSAFATECKCVAIITLTPLLQSLKHS